MPTPDPNAPRPPSNSSVLSRRQRQWLELGARAGGSIRHGVASVLTRRGMPSVVLGSLILTIGWFGERDSAWGFPMLLSGAVLIFLGLIGPRLSGSVHFEWGEEGARFEVSTAIAPSARPSTDAAQLSGSERPALGATSLVAEPGAAATSERVAAVPAGSATAAGPSAASPPAQVEGSAETIDFQASPLGEGPATGARPAPSPARRPAAS